MINQDWANGILFSWEPCPKCIGELANISERQFSQIASRIASLASEWAADCLDFPDKPMKKEAIQRFKTRINEWLEKMDAPG